MIGGLLVTFCAFVLSTVTYGIGRIHGYDQWDKENEIFQKGLNKRDI